MTFEPAFVAYLNSFPASRYNHKGHRESAYVMVNRRKTSPNTYLELAEYQDSSCRLLRHSKIFAPAHSLNCNSTLHRIHWPFGTQSVKNLLDIIYIHCIPPKAEQLLGRECAVFPLLLSIVTQPISGRG